MIKPIWFIFKKLIYGDDFTVDFNSMVSFEEAMSYLRKGYFIYDAYHPNVLYFLINDIVYAIDTKKEKVIANLIFNTSVSLNTDWKIVSMGKHVNIGDKND